MGKRQAISNSFVVNAVQDGVSVQARYAPVQNPTDEQISYTFRATDKYMSTRESDSATWSPWVRIVGESGGETNYMFGISSQKTTASSTTAPTLKTGTTWSDAPVQTEADYPYLWSKVQKKDGSGNNVGSATYIRLTGDGGVVYSIETSVSSVTIPSNAGNTTLTCNVSIWQKEGNNARKAFTGYLAVYKRSGTTYTYVSIQNVSSVQNLTVNDLRATHDGVVFYLFSSSYTGNAPEGQSYLARTEVIVKKNGNDGKSTRYIKAQGGTRVGSSYTDLKIEIYNGGTTKTVIPSQTIPINADAVTGNSRGLVLCLIERDTLDVEMAQFYDTYYTSNGSRTRATALANKITSQDCEGYFIVLVSYDAIGWNDDLINALKAIGGIEPEYTSAGRYPFAFIGRQGLPDGFAVQKIGSYEFAEPVVVSTTIVEDDMVSARNGKDGQRGKTGKFYYYANEWNVSDMSKTFSCSDAEAPYFKSGSQYWMFVADVTFSSKTMSWINSTYGAPSSNNSNWSLMANDFKYIITEAIFGNYAHFGSFIINGDWMISQYGKMNGVESGAYTSFDPTTPVVGANMLYNNVDVPYNNTAFDSFPLKNGIQYSFTITVSTSSTKLQFVLKNSAGTTATTYTVNQGAATLTQTITYTPTANDTFYFTLEKWSSSTTVKATITVSRSNVWEPNLAFDGRKGQSYQVDGLFRGVVKASLTYSPTQVISGTQTVYLNPYVDLCNSFRISAVNSEVLNIYLPDAEQFDGLEYHFISVVTTGVTMGTMTIRKMGSLFMLVLQQNGYYAEATYFQMPINTYVTMRAMNGAWVMVQGKLNS